VLFSPPASFRLLYGKNYADKASSVTAATVCMNCPNRNGTAKGIDKAKQKHATPLPPQTYKHALFVGYDL